MTRSSSSMNKTCHVAPPSVVRETVELQAPVSGRCVRFSDQRPLSVDPELAQLARATEERADAQA